MTIKREQVVLSEEAMEEQQKQQQQDEEEPSPQSAHHNAPSSALTLSKSWAVTAAHVQTYTGGKVTHSSLTRAASGNSEDETEQQATTSPALPMPFLLLPVGGDLAVVDARRGVKWRTLLTGNDGTVQDNNNDDDDDDNDSGMDAITCYALSHNDDILVTASRNQLLRLYRLASFEKTNLTLPAPVEKVWGRSGHALPITHMEFHTSNIFLATGSVDGTVRIWDARGGYVTHVFRPLQPSPPQGSSSGGMHAVTALQWRPHVSDLTLAVARQDGSVAIHNLRDTIAKNKEEVVVVVLRDHVSAVTCMEWPEHMEDIFVSTGRDAVLNTWLIQKEQPAKSRKKKKKGHVVVELPKLVYKRIHTLPIYEQVEGMAVLPTSVESELVLATAGSKGVVRLWKAHRTASGLSGFQCFVEQPATESFGAERGGYMALRYKATENNKQEGDIPVSTKQLIVADAEHNLSFLSLSDKNDGLLSVERTIVGHNDEILDLRVIPSPKSVDDSQVSNKTSHIAVATNSAQVRLFDLKTFSCEVLDGHSATVLCVDVSPCGRYLATCGKDKTMRVWHLGSHRCVAVATGHTEAIGATAFSRKPSKYEVRGKSARNGGGAFAMSASKDRTLKRWNLPGAMDLDQVADSNGAPQISLVAFASARAHEKDINIVSVAPNDSLIATGSQDKTVKLWRATDLSLQATLKGHRRGVWDCQFSPFDRVVATASGDRTVKLWSLSDYSCVRTFQGHVASALRVRFLSGGLQLISSGADGLVKLWTIRTNECETTLDGHADKVWALDLSTDGKTLVSGGADSQIVVWADTTQEEEAAKRATEEENILMEQKLANHLRHKEFEQALEIALDLEKPMQALKVLNSIVEDDIQKGQNGLETLQRHVKGWTMTRTTQVLRYCRDWNTRARNSHIAMLVIKAVMTSIPAHRLAAEEGIPEILAGITPYAERHFERLDRLLASTYLLDFALHSMGSLDAMELDDAKAYAEWESQSKLVLPPKRIDGRVQLGGSALVGATKGDDASQTDEVVTIGDSDSSDDEGITETPEEEVHNGDFEAGSKAESIGHSDSDVNDESDLDVNHSVTEEGSDSESDSSRSTDSS